MPLCALLTTLHRLLAVADSPAVTHALAAQAPRQLLTVAADLLSACLAHAGAIQSSGAARSAPFSYLPAVAATRVALQCLMPITFALEGQAACLALSKGNVRGLAADAEPTSAIPLLVQLSTLLWDVGTAAAAAGCLMGIAVDVEGKHGMVAAGAVAALVPLVRLAVTTPADATACAGAAYACRTYAALVAQPVGKSQLRETPAVLPTLEALMRHTNPMLARAAETAHTVILSEAQ